MSKVFVSHAASDRQFVEGELMGMLNALGFQAWFAKEDIQTSEHWERAILAALESSEWVLLVMSPRSAKSEWVKDEINWAITERAGRVIPVMIEPCNPRDFHIRLPRIQHLDFFNNPKDARERLIKLLVDAEYKPQLRKDNDRITTRRKSQDFWTNFSKTSLQLVLGRFLEFRSFEPSGLLGVGDAIAMTELCAHLALLNIRNATISYADRLDGDALKTNLVLLGGPDNNSITREVINRIASTIRLGDPSQYVTAIYDSQTQKHYNPLRTSAGLISNDYGLILRSSNPFAPDKQVLLIAGSFGYGTWTGVRFILSEAFLTNQFVIEGSPVECLVEADIFRETPQNIKPVAIRKLE